MAAEARCIAAAEGAVEIRVRCSGARAEGARAAAAALVREGAEALLSFGMAGALAPDLRPGELVLADRIATHDAEDLPLDSRWHRALYRGLGAIGITVRVAAVAGSDQLATTREQKLALGAGTGALVVDMESHIAAAAAQRAGLPFAALRAVADPLDRAIPALALASLRADGSTDTLAVLAGLARQPLAIATLLRLGRDSARALSTLRRVGTTEIIAASLGTDTARS
jgi:adenosylhomocysteine nucleosidase